MSTHWANIALGVTAAGSLTTAIVTAFVAGKTQRAGELAAAATVSQANATDIAAKAGVDAARAAEASARAAEAVIKIETDRRHDDLAPRFKIGWIMARNERTGVDAFQAVVTNTTTHDFHVFGTLIFSSGGTQGVGDEVLLGDGVARFHLSDRGAKPPSEIKLEFNAASDPCRCGRETDGGRHWLRIFPVPDPEMVCPAYV